VAINDPIYLIVFTLVSSNPESLYPMAKYPDEERFIFKACENLLYSIETGNLPFF